MNEALFDTMVALLIATSAAIAVIALLRPLVRRYCGAVAALQLWWMLPLSFAAVLVPKTSTVVWTQTVVLSQSAVTETMAAPVAATPVPWPLLAAALWVFGAVVTIAWLWLAQRRFTHNIRWKENRRGVLPAGDGAAMVGAIAPRLALPEDFASRYSAHERRLILLHERIHLRRGDGIANLAMSALLVVQWFNPLVHWASRALCSDQECACDALIIHRHPASLKTYTEALLKSLPETTQHLPLVCRWLAYHPTVERISMLRQHRDLRRSVKLLAALFVAGLSLTSAIVYAVRPATVVVADGPPPVPVVPAVSAAKPAPPSAPLAPASQPVPPVPPAAVVPAPVAVAPATPAAPAAPSIVARAAQEAAGDSEDAAAARQQYRVNVKMTRVSTNGDTPPNTSRKSGEFAIVLQERAKMVADGLLGDIRLTMTATQSGENILLSTVIESGAERKVIGKPSILVPPGKRGAIEIGSDSGTGPTDVTLLEVTVDPITAEQAESLRANTRIAKAKLPTIICRADDAIIAEALNAMRTPGTPPLSIRREGDRIRIVADALSSAQAAEAMRLIAQSCNRENQS